MAVAHRWWVRLVSVLLAVSWSIIGFSHQSAHGKRLPKIGPAPMFTLTTQDGATLSLHTLRGKIVVVTFIFTSCADACPLLTMKLAQLQARLGADIGSKIFFASITVDPERDTPTVLTRYADGYQANRAGWAFLTGTADEIRDVATHYGVASGSIRPGDVDHTFLTSIVDQSGILRVQYMGTRFAVDEFLQDLQSLLHEDVR